MEVAKDGNSSGIAATPPQDRRLNEHKVQTAPKVGQRMPRSLPNLTLRLGVALLNQSLVDHSTLPVTLGAFITSMT